VGRFRCAYHRENAGCPEVGPEFREITGYGGGGVEKPKPSGGGVVTAAAIDRFIIRPRTLIDARRKSKEKHYPSAAARIYDETEKYTRRLK